MNLSFTEDIVLAKVATIQKCVGVLRRLWFDNEPALPEWVFFDITVLNLQRAVEACLDLTHHLIAANSWGLAASAGEAIGMLVGNRILPAEEAVVYRGMIGFRNIAVHNYRELDRDIIAGIDRDHLGDLEHFAQRILESTVVSAHPGNQ